MKMHHLAAALLSLASLNATAADFSYTHVEAGYNWTKLDRSEQSAAPAIGIDDVKADGYYLKGSIELGQSPFYLFGGYRQAEDDKVGLSLSAHQCLFLRCPPNLDMEIKQYDVGLGYHHSLSERVDLIADLSYVHTKVDVDTPAGFTRISASDDGDDYRVGVGIRGNLASNLEGWVKATYTDGDFYDSQFGGTLGLLVKFNPTWGLVGEAEIGDDIQTYSVGVRASF